MSTDTREALAAARSALGQLIEAGKAVKAALDAAIPDGEPVNPESRRLTWPISSGLLALDAVDAVLATQPAQPHCGQCGAESYADALVRCNRMSHGDCQGSKLWPDGDEPAHPSAQGEAVAEQMRAIAADFPDKLFTGFSNLMESAKKRGSLEDVAYIKSLRDLFSEVVRAFVHYPPTAQPSAQGEAVAVEAVAEVKRTEDGLELEWLVEGGICALVEGCVLVMPHRPITGDDGSGEVFLASAPAAPAQAVPEGCTPADAAMLRRANHALADEAHLLQEALADLHKQIGEFVATNGEADFYTGFALAVLAKTRPLEYQWPYSSPTAEEAINRGIKSAP